MNLDADRWVDAYGDALFRFALQRVKQIEVAEDLVQETFLAAVQSRDRFKGPRKNNFPFYPSRLQAIFARSQRRKILKRACYSSGFAPLRANKSDPNPGA